MEVVTEKNIINASRKQMFAKPLGVTEPNQERVQSLEPQPRTPILRIRVSNPQHTQTPSFIRNSSQALYF